MKLREICEILEADIVHGEDPDREIDKVGAADLMSDVLTHSTRGSLLLTGLTNSQVIRTAEMSDIEAVCFVRGKRPQAGVIKLGEEMGIPVLVTRFSMYEACGKLYMKGLRGCEHN
ncbi:MAG: hypothetical protein HY926_02805 [Elusimicrobia bacterium]|nr:hypothetical protein [Elusimicrobiota bacterium]